MNLVIKPSRSWKAHPNWVTEKQLTTVYRDVDRVLEKEVWLEMRPGLATTGSHRNLRLERQRKEWFLESERAVPWL